MHYFFYKAQNENNNVHGLALFMENKMKNVSALVLILAIALGQSACSKKNTQKQATAPSAKAPDGANEDVALETVEGSIQNADANISEMSPEQLAQFAEEIATGERELTEELKGRIAAAELDVEVRIDFQRNAINELKTNLSKLDRQGDSYYGRGVVAAGIALPIGWVSLITVDALFPNYAKTTLSKEMGLLEDVISKRAAEAAMQRIMYRNIPGLSKRDAAKAADDLAIGIKKALSNGYIKGGVLNQVAISQGLLAREAILSGEKAYLKSKYLRARILKFLGYGIGAAVVYSAGNFLAFELSNEEMQAIELNMAAKEKEFQATVAHWNEIHQLLDLDSVDPIFEEDAPVVEETPADAPPAPEQQPVVTESVETTEAEAIL